MAYFSDEQTRRQTAMTMTPQLDHPEGAPAVIYLRVSSKEQAKKGGEAEGFSLPAQREGCKRKAGSLSAAVIEEFVERGESAKTADRPELQRMLAFIVEHPVKYVIVHKVDRLARNRADDVAISLAIRQAGAELVSVSENIDETPSGLLLHGIMAAIGEFYSRNLANEVIKGTVQKAKNGGTPGRAPTGYLNVRRMVEGREARTIEIDPVRGPLITWAFDAYRTGEWTIRRLLAELTDRGLTTAPTSRGPGKPLSVSHLHKLLRHPYYIRLVRYRGVLYPGKHEPLTTPETWHEVQTLLSAKHLTGEKDREHPHYLKGSIYCGQCGARLIICHAKGRGGTYPYFICIGRQQKRTNCKQRAIRIEQAEAAIASYYASVQLVEGEVVQLRAFLAEELSKLRADADRERTAQARRLRKLEGERKKLLEAHYADAVPLDLLKSEQDRLTREVANAEGRLAEIVGDFQKAEANLQRAVNRVGDCAAAYGAAADRMRRQFNLAFFKRLLLDDEGMVSGELAEPFELLLGEELRRAAVAQASDELREAVDEALRRRSSEGRLVPNDQRPQGPEALVGAAATSTLSGCGGFSPKTLVRMRGLEPPPGFPDTDLNRARLPIPPHPRAGESEDTARPGPSAWSPVHWLASHCYGRCRTRLVLGALLASSADALPLSSRGLGRRPLMAETGVRIPVAVFDWPRVYGAFRVLEAPGEWLGECGTCVRLSLRPCAESRRTPGAECQRAWPSRRVCGARLDRCRLSPCLDGLVALPVYKLIDPALASTHDLRRGKLRIERHRRLAMGRCGQTRALVILP
jgi:site-specific DNA recombinase